jgi:excisionase family DNA binding protein
MAIPSVPLDSAPTVLTMSEIARELRCSKTHVHNIIEGRVRDLPPLPVIRIGRRVLIRHDALLRWMIWLEKRESEIQRGSGFFIPRDEDLESIGGA